MPTCPPPLRVSTLTASLALVLSACAGGGGGGGGSLIRPDTPGETPSPSTPSPQYATPTARNPNRLTIPEGSEILVSVADSAINATHAELSSGQIAEFKYNDDGSEPFASGGVADHGTAVAARIAGAELGHAGNVKLLISQAGTTSFTSSRITSGHEWAMSRGARVMNISTTIATNAMRNYGDMFRMAANNGVLISMAAGNDGANLSTRHFPGGTAATGSLFGAEGDALRANLLVVGAVTEAGVFWSESNYPGERQVVQDRFLVANGASVTIASGSGGYWTGSGTSYAAPVVAAGAATVMSLWPHLTGSEVASLLLDTASKASPLYARNDCGASGRGNCGYFYLGQGELDMEAALRPQGALTVPQSETISGPAAPLATTGLRLAGAFGDAGAHLAGVEFAAFDALGRDYTVPVRGQVSDSTTRGSQLTRRLDLLAEHYAAHAWHSEQRTRFAHSTLRLQYGADGTLRQFDAAGSLGGGATWRLFSNAGVASNLLDDTEAVRSMPLLSMLDAERSTTSSPYVTGVGVTAPIGSLFAVGTTHWVGHGAQAVADREVGNVRGSRVELELRPVNALSLRLGVGVSTESTTVLGSRSSGALALAGGAMTHFASFALDYDLGGGVSLFARHQASSMDSASGRGMVRTIADVRASESAAGAVLAGEGWQAAAVVSAPMRVDAATLTLSLPSGRTLDGRVLTTPHTVGLSPSGRQRNLELAYSRQLDNGGVVGLNLMHTREPGHVQGAASEYAAMMHLGWVF